MTETEGKIMKKILIATTALVATAGVAAADVRICRATHVLVHSTTKALTLQRVMQLLLFLQLAF
jgi:hypothetical protein